MNAVLAGGLQDRPAFTGFHGLVIDRKGNGFYFRIVLVTHGITSLCNLNRIKFTGIQTHAAANTGGFVDPVGFFLLTGYAILGTTAGA
jgi:hypothetical protein